MCTLSTAKVQVTSLNYLCFLYDLSLVSGRTASMLQKRTCLSNEHIQAIECDVHVTERRLLQCRLVLCAHDT